MQNSCTELNSYQLKADSKNKEPKSEVEASKIPEQIHDLHNTDYDNGYKEI